MALLRTVFQKRKQYFDPGFWSISLTRWELHRVTIEMKAHKHFYLWTFVGRDSHRLLFYYKSVFTILQPLGSGYHEIKVNELPDWDWAWSDGTTAANWGSRKGSLRVFVFVFFLPSYIPHLSMHLEKSRRLSVLWTIWNFSMISAEKVPGSFDFCHHRGVDFAS